MRASSVCLLRSGTWKTLRFFATGPARRNCVVYVFRAIRVALGFAQGGIHLRKRTLLKVENAIDVTSNSGDTNVGSYIKHSNCVVYVFRAIRVALGFAQGGIHLRKRTLLKVENAIDVTSNSGDTNVGSYIKHSKCNNSVESMFCWNPFFLLRPVCCAVPWARLGICGFDRASVVARPCIHVYTLAVSLETDFVSEC